MKRLLFLFALLGITLFGVWWLLLRAPDAVPPSDPGQVLFQGRPLREWAAQLGEKEPDRGKALAALAAVGPEERDLAPGLALLLAEDPSRAALADALVRIGPDALPDIHEALKAHQGRPGRRDEHLAERASCRR